MEVTRASYQSNYSLPVVVRGSSPFLCLQLLYKIQKSLIVVEGTAILANYFPNN